MIENYLGKIFRGALSGIRLHRESKPNTIDLPEGVYHDFSQYVGTRIKDGYGSLRIDAEFGCEGGMCVDVYWDGRPSQWEPGNYLHAHLLTSNQIVQHSPGHWEVTRGHGYGSEEDFFEVLSFIRDRLVSGTDDPKYLRPPSRLKPPNS